MKTRLFLALSLLGLGAWAVTPLTPAQVRTDLPAGVEVVTRGPVHEAYAEPGEVVTKEFVVVPRRPPDPVAEMPPDQRPEGEDMAWVPGYWAWEDEPQSFLWVSGFWRQEPPDRHWVPSFWQEVEGGWHRVNGFWASDRAQEVQYVPPPPEPIPESPPQAVEAASFFVPGTWVYYETRYVWRPGFSVPYQPGWVYTQARYYWTPAGNVFVDGYWDYPLHRRGLLFAPLRVTTATVQPFRYVPSYAIYPDALMTSLFVRPATRTYYFGDYYENRYVRGGYVPWVDYRVARNVSDANYAYYRETFRNNQRWETDLRNLYTARLEGRAPRPPRTLAQQAQVIRNVGNVRTETNIATVNNLRIAAPLTEINNARLTLGNLTADARTTRDMADNVVRIQPVSPDMRRQVEQRATQYRQLTERRQADEVRLIKDGERLRPGDRPLTRPFEAPRRPDAARAERPADRTPPPPPRVPQPDTRATPDRPKADRPPADRPKADRPDATPDRPKSQPPRPVAPGTPTDRPKAPPVERPRDTTPPPRPGDPPRQAPPDRPKTEQPKAPPRPETPPRQPPPERPKADPPQAPPPLPPRAAPPERPKADPPKAPPTAPPRQPPPERPKADPPKAPPPAPPRQPPPERPKADPPKAPAPPRPVPPERPKSDPPGKDRPKDKDKNKDGG